MESPGGHCKACAVCDQEQSKRSFPYDIPLGVSRRRVMDSLKTTVGKVNLVNSSGAEAWKDVLQLQKEQNEKMERFARALSIIQQGMLRNNPRHVADSVNEATEALGGMLNTHKCLLESGVEIQKRLESHPATKKMGIFRRPRSASKVSSRDGQSYADILREMKAKVDPRRAGLEVLSIRRT